MTDTETTSQPPAPPVAKKSTVPDPLTEDGILILCRLAERGVDRRLLAYAFGLKTRTVNRLIERDSWKIGPSITQKIEGIEPAADE